MRRALAALAFAMPALCIAKPPPCTNWPMNMALTVLKNAGVTDPTKLDESKTKFIQLASEPIGKGVYRQIYDITFYEKTGAEIEVVTSTKASWKECSLDSVDVYIVSKKYNSDAPTSAYSPQH
jgi:hypothetical protein